jgi:dihydrofolate synthase/folylpolyglutamate synthase
VVDTGHNVGGITYVVEQLKQQSFDRLHIVIGMVNDKDINHVLDLLPRDAEYYFTQANVARALPANEMKLQAERHGLVGNAYTSVLEAVNTAKKNASDTDFIFIGGSNFVVGEALKP